MQPHWTLCTHLPGNAQRRHDPVATEPANGSAAKCPFRTPPLQPWPPEGTLQKEKTRRRWSAPLVSGQAAPPTWTLSYASSAARSTSMLHTRPASIASAASASRCARTAPSAARTAARPRHADAGCAAVRAVHELLKPCTRHTCFFCSRAVTVVSPDVVVAAQRRWTDT